MRRFLAADTGSSLVELAVIAPVLMVMLVGALNISLLLQWDMSVIDSTRAAAQYATLPTSTLTGITDTAKKAASAVPGYTAVATESCLCGSAAGASACSGGGTCSVGKPITYITITGRATLPIKFPTQWLPNSIPVRSVVRVRSVGGA